MKYIKTAYHEFMKFANNLSDNSVGAYSAQAAFFIITSFFPFMLLMVSLLQFIPIDTSEIQETLSDEVLPIVGGDFISSIIREVTTRATPGALLGAAGISAIWAASRCLISIIQGLNKVYSCESKRSWYKLRLISVVYVFVLQFLLIISLGILVFGEQINDRLAEEFNLLVLTHSAINQRWIITFLLLILFFMLAYKFVPERKTHLLNEMPGAVLSAVGWLGFSALFSIYIDDFSDFGAVYGSLAAAVILMLWLYFCMFILFVGAQFNVWLQNKGVYGITVKEMFGALKRWINPSKMS